MILTLISNIILICMSAIMIIINGRRFYPLLMSMHAKYNRTNSYEGDKWKYRTLLKYMLYLSVVDTSIAMIVRQEILLCSMVLLFIIAIYISTYTYLRNRIKSYIVEITSLLLITMLIIYKVKALEYGVQIYSIDHLLFILGSCWAAGGYMTLYNNESRNIIEHHNKGIFTIGAIAAYLVYIKLIIIQYEPGIVNHYFNGNMSTHIALLCAIILVMSIVRTNKVVLIIRSGIVLYATYL